MKFNDLFKIKMCNFNYDYDNILLNNTFFNILDMNILLIFFNIYNIFISNIYISHGFYICFNYGTSNLDLCVKISNS